MKWLLLALGLVALLGGLVALVGAALPLRHHATRKARFRVAPESLYAVMVGPPDWRSGVKRFGAMPDRDGRRQWWEEDQHGQKITYEVVENVAASVSPCASRTAICHLAEPGRTTSRRRQAEGPTCEFPKMARSIT
jgi:hypothetical protein